MADHIGMVADRSSSTPSPTAKSVVSLPPITKVLGPYLNLPVGSGLPGPGSRPLLPRCYQYNQDEAMPPGPHAKHWDASQPTTQHPPRPSVSYIASAKSQSDAALGTYRPSIDLQLPPPRAPYGQVVGPANHLHTETATRSCVAASSTKSTVSGEREGKGQDGRSYVPRGDSVSLGSPSYNDSPAKDGGRDGEEDSGRDAGRDGKSGRACPSISVQMDQDTAARVRSVARPWTQARIMYIHACELLLAEKEIEGLGEDSAAPQRA